MKRNEAVNHMYEYSKLAQKEYKPRHDWVGKANHWESWKKFKFANTTKWYMNKPESVRENKTHKFLWDVEIK